MILSLSAGCSGSGGDACQGMTQSFSDAEIGRRAGGVSRSACLGIFSALEIERRPREALVLVSSASMRSSAARAAHRGQARSYICCNAPFQSGHGCSPWRTAEDRWGAGSASQKNRVVLTRLATMAYQAMARCNKCGSGLAPRSAARAALDLKGAEDLKAGASRCAAQTALDIMGAIASTPHPALNLQGPTAPVPGALTPYSTITLSRFRSSNAVPIPLISISSSTEANGPWASL